MRSIVLAIFVAVMWIALNSPQQAQAAPAQGCGVNLAAPEIQTAINSVPTVPQGWPWDHNPRSFDRSSNYNPCATLSAEDVPGSVELRWRSGEHQAALTSSLCTTGPTGSAVWRSRAERSVGRCR